MNVLQCVPTINPEWGGSIEACRLLTIGLVAQGHGVEVVSVDQGGNDWYKAWPCPVHNLGPSYTPLLYSPRVVPWLINNAPRFDAVLVHSVWLYIGYAVWKASRRSGLKYFLFTHGMLDPWFKSAHPVKHLKKSIFWRVAGHKIFHEASGVLYTAEDEQRLASISFAPYSCKEHVVGLGIEDPSEKYHMDGNEFRRRYNVPPGVEYLLFLGRITQKKRVDLLIEAFASIYADTQTCLIIAGPDGEGLQRQLSTSAHANMLRKQLIWTGQIDGNMKWSAIKGADAFALISHTENFGIGIAEALALGVPVLTTNKVNIWREIEGGNAGLIESDNLEGAKRLLIRWRALTSAQKQEVRSNARVLFRNSFDIDRAVTKLVTAMVSIDEART